MYTVSVKMSGEFRRERSFLHVPGPRNPLTPSRQHGPVYLSKNHDENQGLLAGLLSAPYVVQRLGDFDPGLEFKTAMLYADASTRLQPAAGAAAGTVLPRREEGQGGEAAMAAPEKAAGEAAGRREGERGRKGLPGEKECAIVLGDRDVQETLRRLGGSLTALTGPRGGGGGEQHGGGGGVGGRAGMLGTGAGDVGERDLKVRRWGVDILFLR